MLVLDCWFELLEIILRLSLIIYLLLNIKCVALSTYHFPDVIVVNILLYLLQISFLRTVSYKL